MLPHRPGILYKLVAGKRMNLHGRNGQHFDGPTFDAALGRLDVRRPELKDGPGLLESRLMKGRVDGAQARRTDPLVVEHERQRPRSTVKRIETGNRNICEAGTRGDPSGQF